MVQLEVIPTRFKVKSPPFQVKLARHHSLLRQYQVSPVRFSRNSYNSWFYLSNFTLYLSTICRFPAKQLYSRPISRDTGPVSRDARPISSNIWPIWGMFEIVLVSSCPMRSCPRLVLIDDPSHTTGTDNKTTRSLQLSFLGWHEYKSICS